MLSQLILSLLTLGIVGGCPQERFTAAAYSASSRVRLILPSIAALVLTASAAARATIITARDLALDGFGQDIGLRGSIPLVQHHHTGVHHFTLSAALLVQ